MRKILNAMLRGLVWCAAFVLIVAVAGGMGAGLLSLRAADAPDAAEPLPVAVTPAVIQDRYIAVRRFPGRIEAAQVADVSFQVNGEIAAVNAQIGDRVEAGDILAELDPVRINNRRDELAAAQAEAQASLARAEAALTRTQRLIEEGFATAQNLDDATAERDSLRARVRQLGEALATARQDVDDAALRAPFAGVIVQRYVDSGVTVNAGQPIFRINANGALDALIGVPARFATQIQVGDTHTLEAGDLQAEGRVTGVSDNVDTATQTVTVRLEIAEDPGFVPGSLVRVALTEERAASGAWAPATALNESYRGLWSVYVVIDEEGEQRIARKDVEVIHIGDTRVFVSGTLEDGDRIVRAAPFRFAPGQRVRIVDDASNLLTAESAS